MVSDGLPNYELMALRRMRSRIGTLMGLHDETHATVPCIQCALLRESASRMEQRITEIEGEN